MLANGEAFWAQERPFFLERHGYPEETYFDVSYDPVRDESRRILIVDDNADAASTLKEALEALGHVVTTASDGPAALEAAGGFQPDVALVDIGLPVMDGYDLAHRLRQSPKMSPDLKLIAVTGYGLEADRLRSSSAGFVAHLVKPVDLAVLASYCT